ncbi:MULTISPECIES: hypothetical protein [unclassified Janthinobacterium]|uniref:hypothetical protein n=1 Tax=unclassified Janthinobacterium TaxID=2610881 RepID=UPI00161CDEA1|nr:MULTISPECIES: hypothetical protein [unclassified Janthinobacterium]MBB5370211.1 hypothetical protein [Janthinobacterium sp. K2C7]MBB5383017.1 hypothetical protein [Janthinobacterium sp. K2Li3]MBB5388504.1 hypothetical protein [Janthinobacterium sp. K2E3]
MKKNIFGFLFILIWMSFLFFQEKNRPPSTKNFYISQKIKGTSLQNYIVKCNGTSGGVISETCILSGKPNVEEVDRALKNVAWVDFFDNRYAFYSYQGWCKEHAKIYIGQGKNGWQIKYVFEMNFNCPN